MTNDGARQATVRSSTGTALTYEGDWHALFDRAGIAGGPFNGRLLAWVNAQLSTAYTEINGALDAFAISQGAPNWSSLGSFTIGGGGGGSPSADFSQSSNSMYVPALAA